MKMNYIPQLTGSITFDQCKQFINFYNCKLPLLLVVLQVPPFFLSQLAEIS